MIMRLPTLSLSIRGAATGNTDGGADREADVDSGGEDVGVVGASSRAEQEDLCDSSAGGEADEGVQCHGGPLPDPMAELASLLALTELKGDVSRVWNVQLGALGELNEDVQRLYNQPFGALVEEVQSPDGHGKLTRGVWVHVT